MNIRHSVLRNKWKNAGKWQENSSLLQWQCICEHSSNSFPFASLSFASSPIVMKLKIIFFRNGQSCQRANNRLQECDPQYRGAEWAGVTQRSSHVRADFRKMKQDWQISQGRGLRPWGSAPLLEPLKHREEGLQAQQDIYSTSFSEGSSRSRLIPRANQTLPLKWPLAGKTKIPCVGHFST